MSLRRSATSFTQAIQNKYIMTWNPFVSDRFPLSSKFENQSYSSGGQTIASGINGETGGSLQFNQISNLTLSTAVFASAYSVALWIYPTIEDVVNSASCFTTSVATAIRINFRYFNPTQILVLSNDGVDPNLSIPGISLNTWNHIGFVWNGTYSANNFTVYCNGASVGTFSNTLYNFVQMNAQIGVRGGNTGWNGRLAKARVFNSVLTAQDFKELYTKRI